MKTAAVLLCLVVVVPALAADGKPWPQKGDTVYVSAAIQARLSEYTGVASSPGQVAIKACVPLTVAHRRAGGSSPGWGMESAERLYAGFRGERWPERFHHTESECREALSRLGEAAVVGTEGVNVYSPGAPATQ